LFSCDVFYSFENCQITAGDPAMMTSRHFELSFAVSNPEPNKDEFPKRRHKTRSLSIDFSVVDGVHVRIRWSAARAGTEAAEKVLHEPASQADSSRQEPG
jgi:hypothetical protein